MYNLTFLEGDQMKVTKNDEIVFVGPGAMAVNYAVEELQLPKEDVFLAFQILLENPDHDSAHFGVLGGFIYTEKLAA